MVISAKDGIKLLGITIVSACAVFVSTFMLNYYLDVMPLRSAVADPATEVLFAAQTAMAKFCACITGGALAAIAAVMLIFYIKLYVDAHAKQLGIIKAMGYGAAQIALRFAVFGLSVFIGCALGFGLGWAAMPLIYKQMTIEGLDVGIGFHAELLSLIFAPTVFFTALSVLAAYITLRRPVGELLRGKADKEKPVSVKSGSDKTRPFKTEMSFAVLKSKKSLAFFVSFACFCFSAMVQMGMSMESLSTETMGLMILVIGLVLAVVSMFMAITSLIRGNVKSIAVMKAFGYSVKECAVTVLLGYVPFALIGFGLGTVYQYGLLKFMVNVVFADVGNVPEYSFNVPVFFGTFAAFVVCYFAVMAYYTLRISKISVKEIMTEN